MKNTLKKIIALLTVLVIVSTLLPVGVFAEDGAEESVVYENEEPAEETAEEAPEEEPAAAPEEEAEPAPEEEPEEESVIASDRDAITHGEYGDLEWTLSGGTLSITGSGAIPDSVAGEAPWYEYRDQITSLSIGSGVTKIGANAFYGLDQLAGQLTIPGTVQAVDYAAFMYCSGITSLKVETGVQTIGDRAFGLCSKLQSAEIAGTVTSIGEDAFMQCAALQTVTFARGLTSIGVGAFSNCGSLQSLSLPDGLTSIGISAFSYCRALGRVDLPGTLTSVGRGAFFSCANADFYFHGSAEQWAAVTIGPDAGFTPENVHILYTAYGTSGNIAWYISPEGTLVIDGSGDGSMLQYSTGGAPWYSYKDQIKAITIEPGVTTLGMDAFYGLDHLEGLVTIPGTVQSIESSAFMYSSVPSVKIEEGVQTIKDYAFDGCTALSSVEIAGSVTTIAHAAFKDCTALQSVVFHEGLVAIGEETFAYCRKLTSLCLPEGLTSIGEEAFYACISLGRVDLPGTLTEVGVRAFTYCSAASFYYHGTAEQWAVVSNASSSNITSENLHILFAECGTAGDLFWYITPEGTLVVEGSGAIPDYEQVVAPWGPFAEDITGLVISEGVTAIGAYAFAYLDNMITVSLPSTLQAFGEYAFFDSSGIERVDTPSLAAWMQIAYLDGGYSTPLYGSETAKLYIDGELLTRLVLPEDCTEIGSMAFMYCRDLEEVVLSRPWIEIADYAFEGCDNLQRVVYPGTESEAQDLIDYIDESSYGNWCLTHAEWICLPDLAWAEAVQSYVILEENDTFQLQLKISDERYLTPGRIIWESENPDIASVDRNGVVTAHKRGTARVYAFIFCDSGDLTVHYRIDVVRGAPEEKILGISTVKSSAAVKLYSTDYAEIPIQPLLEQNGYIASALIPEEDLPEAAATAAITSARFLNSKAEALFDLVPKGDRTLQIVPKYSALELAQTDPKAIKDTYKSKIEITVGEGDGAKTYILQKGKGDATLTLTVKKTKPSVKATAGKINSLVPGHTVSIKLKGGTVTALELNPAKTSSADIAVDLESRTVPESTLTKGTRNVYLLATVEGWAVKVPVTLKVSVAPTKPTVRLSKTSLTLNGGTFTTKEVTVKITPAAYRDSRYFADIISVTEDGQDVTQTCGLNVFLYGGTLYLDAGNVVNPQKTHTFKIRVGLFSMSDLETPLAKTTLTVKVKPVSSKAALKLTASGAIDLTVPDSPVRIKPALSNYSGSVSISEIKITDPEGNVVSGQFGLGFDPVREAFLLRANEANAPEPGTYRFRIKVGIRDGMFLEKAVKFTVKRSAPEKVPVSITASATGSIQIIREDSHVTVRPKVKNWYRFEPDPRDIVITKTYDAATGKKVSEDVTNRFWVEVDEENGCYLIYSDSRLDPADKFTYRIVTEINGKTVKSKAAKLSVKMGSVKMTQNIKSGIMYSDDVNSTLDLKLSYDEERYGVIARAQVQKPNKSRFEADIVPIDGTIRIRYYRGHREPGTYTVKIKVWLNGNNTETANKTVTVKITVK